MKNKNERQIKQHKNWTEIEKNLRK